MSNTNLDVVAQDVVSNTDVVLKNKDIFQDSVLEILIVSDQEDEAVHTTELKNVYAHEPRIRVLQVKHAALRNPVFVRGTTRVAVLFLTADIETMGNYEIMGALNNSLVSAAHVLQEHPSNLIVHLWPEPQA